MSRGISVFQKQPKRVSKFFAEKSIKLDEKERNNLFTLKRSVCEAWFSFFFFKKEKTEESTGKRSEDYITYA